jgi:hypothetical protein
VSCVSLSCVRQELPASYPRVDPQAHGEPTIISQTSCVGRSPQCYVYASEQADVWGATRQTSEIAWRREGSDNSSYIDTQKSSLGGLRNVLTSLSRIGSSLGRLAASSLPATTQSIPRRVRSARCRSSAGLPTLTSSRRTSHRSCSRGICRSNELNRSPSVINSVAAASGGTVTLRASTQGRPNTRTGSDHRWLQTRRTIRLPVVVAFAEAEANEMPLSTGPQRHSRVLPGRLQSLDIDTDT